MKIIASVLILICFGHRVFAASPNKSEMVTQAHRAILDDQEINIFKAKNPGFYFTHPSFIDHKIYKTLRYHEVYRENPGGESFREWDVMGGSVSFHYIEPKQISKITKRIVIGSGRINLANLIGETTLGDYLGQALSLRHTISPSDYTIHHKLILEGDALSPIYWVEVKSRALIDSSYSRQGARVVGLNAHTGEIIYNFSKRRHIEAIIPPIVIRDGRMRSQKTKKFGEDDDLSKVASQFDNLCQLISEKKGSKGAPVLVHPLNCEAVIQNNLVSTMADLSATRANTNMKSVLGFYLKQLNQYGFDNDPGKKTPISSIVHIGENYDNAYWDEDLSIMVYGDGSFRSGGSSHDYTLALDIAGHEFTHAIVSNTANLNGDGDPGALNEGFADILGVLISRSENKFDSWAIGAKLYDNPNESDEVALRSLSDPSKYKTSTNINGKDIDVPFPNKYSQRLAQNQKCTDDNDGCEVHANSTIWSHNAYLIDRYLQDSLGLKSEDADKKTATLFFLTMTHKVHENDSMLVAAKDTIETCNELYDANTCEVVKKAFVETELLF